ncbi:pyridoxamine 5'-phosphate oxidase family protein [[Clostridium] leptum]|nr:pyridoxamine 5'-phosphate oxidase family protein [[Clostridium] leptum]
MQYQMRRSKRALPEHQARAILEKGEYGVLSLQGEEPYGIPLSYVVHQNCIYFHCALEGRKIDCMRSNPSVSFCVVGKVQPKHRPLYFTTLFESAIVTGKAQPVEDIEEKTLALVELCKKYFPELSPQVKEEAAQSARNSMDRTGVYRISIDEITGKSNIPQEQEEG